MINKNILSITVKLHNNHVDNHIKI